jgi:K+-transporting ATPase KdpF subunit
MRRRTSPPDGRASRPDCHEIAMRIARTRRENRIKAGANQVQDNPTFTRFSCAGAASPGEFSFLLGALAASSFSDPSGATMTFDLLLTSLFAVGLLAYLVAVLLRPERF